MTDETTFSVLAGYAPRHLGIRKFRPGIFWQAILAIALLILVATMSGPRVLETVEGFLSTSQAAPPAAASLAPAKLDPEWQWKRKAIQFDGMFRKKR